MSNILDEIFGSHNSEEVENLFFEAHPENPECQLSQENAIYLSDRLVEDLAINMRDSLKNQESERYDFEVDLRKYLFSKLITDQSIYLGVYHTVAKIVAKSFGYKIDHPSGFKISFIKE